MVDFILDIDWAIYRNYRISDVHSKVRDKACDFMLEFFRQNKLFKILKYNLTEKGERDWKQIVMHILQNECSIMATDRTTDEVKAVALMAWMTPEWRSWSAARLLVPCPRMLELFELFFKAQREFRDSFPDAKDGRSLHIFFYHLNDELDENACFKLHFFNAICDVARHMKMPRVTMTTMCEKEFNTMTAQQFTKTVTIMYSLFVLRKRGRPFDRLRDINEMYATLFSKNVTPLVPYDEFIIRHPHLSSKEAGKKKEKTVTIETNETTKSEQQEHHPDDD